MAAQEALRIVTDQSPETMLRLWFDCIGESPELVPLEGDRPGIYGEALGMTVYAAAISERTKTYMADRFGIAAAVELGFEINMCRENFSPQSAIIKGTLEFISRTEAECGLWFNYNKALVLLNRGGELILNSDETLWTPDRLIMVASTYRQEALTPQ